MTVTNTPQHAPMPVSAPAAPLAARALARLPSRLRRERLLGVFVTGAAVVVIAAVLGIPAFLLLDAGVEPVQFERLWPLLAGSFKAALFALAFAFPLALAAAAWCARFARPRLRAWLKPLFELFEAVPAVVLGLVAAVTLAPWLARHVLAFVAFLALAPLALAAAGVAWQTFAPRAWQRRCDGREAWLAVPALVAVAVLAAALGGPLATVLPEALSQPATPWNALVVGVVLGLSVMPTMFSLAEDALFAVPASLSDGAYALGATRWQALAGLILRAASPGIAAAVLLGFSRALGETMIVLMASGNTPLVDADPLTGLRSIAANLALEAPEAAPGGAHYRLLLTSALWLFGACFVLNSIAEGVRGRLRRRYAAL